jgi:hypothetical protein
MKTLLAVLFAGLAASAQTITITSSPTTLTPASLPPCGSEPFTVTQTAEFQWTTWCPGSISMQGGTVTGTGTGFCAGGVVPAYCRAGASNSIAPVFQGAWQGNGPWTVYVSVTSITGPGANNAACGIPAITQGATSTAAKPICKPQDCAPDCPPSPIVIDAFGEGFHLTDAAKGVDFRERAQDPLVQMSWTDPAYHNAWLVRPNPDGSVTSLAANMFGNLSPQPPSPDKNGYRALAYWAEQAGCGTLDHLDAANCPLVWAALRLWTDTNQDGIVQREELHTLDSLGVKRISLEYRESRWVDQYGNQFRYVAGIQDEAGAKDNRCYDVFLSTP